ncbi:MAG: pyrophosphohydrolase [Pseudomonadota bacterium]
MVEVKKVLMNPAVFRKARRRVIVAAALMNVSGGILIQKRPAGRENAGLWEFPGGKTEAGETSEAALCREISEELGVNLAQEALLYVGATDFISNANHFQLKLFTCDTWQGAVRALDQQDLRWVRPDQLALINLTPADVALIPALLARL